jgi:hypothetical protein
VHTGDEQGVQYRSLGKGQETRRWAMRAESTSWTSCREGDGDGRGREAPWRLGLGGSMRLHSPMPVPGSSQS